MGISLLASRFVRGRRCEPPWLQKGGVTSVSPLTGNATDAVRPVPLACKLLGALAPQSRHRPLGTRLESLLRCHNAVAQVVQGVEEASRGGYLPSGA